MSEETVPDLNELFARDPHDLTKDDISDIIVEMRRDRHLFAQGKMSASGKKPTKPAFELDLSSLTGIAE